ncbi:MAG: type II toxin-antitoxin system RelE/ParE family toxin [Limnochordales bacterium]|nr:type II toxin-antitoxin system RelE/ParE family toxin [Limnochordales bacterium]
MSELYRVRLTRQAEKDLARLRSFRDKAVRALLALERDPYKGHILTGSLCGARFLEFSLPGGAYRAAYVVLEEERTCLVFLVGPLEGFYHKAERRMEALRRLGEI